MLTFISSHVIKDARSSETTRESFLRSFCHTRRLIETKEEEEYYIIMVLPIVASAVAGAGIKTVLDKTVLKKNDAKRIPKTTFVRARTSSSRPT